MFKADGIQRIYFLCFLQDKSVYLFVILLMFTNQFYCSTYCLTSEQCRVVSYWFWLGLSYWLSSLLVSTSLQHDIASYRWHCLLLSTWCDIVVTLAAAWHRLWHSPQRDIACDTRHGMISLVTLATVWHRLWHSQRREITCDTRLQHLPRRDIACNTRSPHLQWNDITCHINQPW